MNKIKIISYCTQMGQFVSSNNPFQEAIPIYDLNIDIFKQDYINNQLVLYPKENEDEYITIIPNIELYQLENINGKLFLVSK